MRGMRARKLVTLTDHRRRQEQSAPLAECVDVDPSEAETTEVPVLKDGRFLVLEAALEEFRVPKLKPRSLGVEPFRSDYEERYGA